MFVALVCRTCGRVCRSGPGERVARLCADCAVIASSSVACTIAHHAARAGDVFAAREYRGPVREVVADLKVRGRRGAARSLGAELARRLAEAGVGRAGSGAFPVDVVTWAPTSDGRRGRRGFDQAELVAREVARRLGLPCRRLLLRDPGPAQTGLDRRQRLGNPHFRARRMESSVVLLVDDVVTTGATLRAAATALHRAGAGSVVRAASLVTPSSVDSRDRPVVSLC